jgi:hypothetical protein
MGDAVMKNDGSDRDQPPESGHDDQSDELPDEQPGEVDGDAVDQADGDEVDGYQADGDEVDAGEVDEDDRGWETDGDQAEWAEPRRSRGELLALAGTFAVGVVLTLVAVLVWGTFSGDDGDSGPTDASSLASRTEPLGSETPGMETPGDATSEPGDAGPHEHAGTTRLSRCTRAARDIETALNAARPSLDQWAVHVGAMNKLVVGEITLQQATDFWNRTRVGAQRRIAAFRDTAETLRRQGVDCPSPALLAPGARALPGCARQVDAEVRAFRAATTSIDTWDEHVGHMDMMRLGELSPERATRMWLSMWQDGVRDLDAYRSVVREARTLGGCSRVGAAG